MTDAEPKRCEGETRADEVRRRVVETVREQLDEIARRAAERHDVDGTKHGASD